MRITKILSGAWNYIDSYNNTVASIKVMTDLDLVLILDVILIKSIGYVGSEYDAYVISLSTFMNLYKDHYNDLNIENFILNKRISKIINIDFRCEAGSQWEIVPEFKSYLEKD